MGFPGNVLADGEKVVRSLHPHALTMLGPTILAAVLTAIAGVVAWVTPDDAGGNRLQWIAVIGAVLLALPLVLVPFLRWRTTHYVLTSHRVMVRKGILSKSGKDITLSKITDVSFRQSLLDRIIRSGTLTIESAGDSADELLRNVPRSDEVQQLINRLIDVDSTRRAAGANG
ncbi:MAG: PH domain-containing protein [Candidatus Phosphoribacter sp.]|nr:PH domain-containing protein [Actinomycetales bacterium]